MSVTIREEVLAIFERHRQTPGAEFEESHFLDYLLAMPKGKRSIHNSFRGLRRYNAFIEDVQMHFSVFLSMKDFQTSYPLDKFVHRIVELQSSRRSSHASFRSHMRSGFGWGTVIVLNILAVALIAAVWHYFSVAAFPLLLVLLAGDAVALKFYLHWRTYHQRLAEALKVPKSNDA